MKTLISFIFLFVVTGCATRPVIVHKDASLTQAAAISDRIDGKAVVVEQWLRAN